MENKDPIKIVDVSIPQTSGSFSQRRNQILDNAVDVIKKPYLNKDTNTMIFITLKSYTHTYSHTSEILLNAIEHLPELISNAVLIHVEGRTHGSEYADGVYTFVSAVKTDRVFPIKLKVKEYRYEGQMLPKNIQDYFADNPRDYAASYDTAVLEVDAIEKSSPGSVRGIAERNVDPGPEELSVIKLAELLNLVKGDSQKYLPKYSDRDSSGNQLTEDQQEYFKDSKVRDGQGRLLVMYHGTPNGTHTTFRSGSYFPLTGSMLMYIKIPERLLCLSRITQMPRKLMKCT